MYMMWHVKMDPDPGRMWLRETLQAIARERIAPAGEQAENVTPFLRRAGQGAAPPSRPRSA